MTEKGWLGKYRQETEDKGQRETDNGEGKWESMRYVAAVVVTDKPGGFKEQ